MKKLVIVNNTKDWQFEDINVDVVDGKSYLTSHYFTELKNVRIFNLCRNYRYQSTGYYVSLLAEARGHKAIPSVTTIQDFKNQTIVKSVSDDIDDLIQKSLKRIKSPIFTLSVYFGKNVVPSYNPLAKALYNLFQAPLLRVTFTFSKKWTLQSITPVPIKEIPLNHKPFVEEFARAYFTKTRFDAKKSDKYIYDLAILINPEEKSPPSNKKALQKFEEVGEKLGFWVEFITPDDYGRLGEFDALFIRETTSVNHYTYRFARKAHTEGLVVIDDPLSILRCTNKVYLSEVLTRERVSTPKTIVVHKDNKNTLGSLLGFPMVLKRPDSSFSQGVLKVSNKVELNKALEELFAFSDLIIAQEFIPTDFDWRIGVLDGKPLYACKYHMARGHWQIYNWDGKGDDQMGMADTFKIEDVPEDVVKSAVRATKFIGDGLYGVDLKKIGKKVYIIEVNDNPSLDCGIEDEYLGDDLYKTILMSIKNRLDRQRNGILKNDP